MAEEWLAGGSRSRRVSRPRHDDPAKRHTVNWSEANAVNY